MTVENVERKLWTCNACGDEEITTGDKPKDWSTLWAWATRHPRNRPDRPAIVDAAVHTCHECSSGPMYFIVRRLIEHLTDDKAREFKGERCKTPECLLPDKHESDHKIPHSRAVPVSTTIVHKTDAKPPPLHGGPLACSNSECVISAHEGVIHMDADGNEFEHPEVDKSGKPYDDYPGVLSTGDDGEILEVQHDHPDACDAWRDKPRADGGVDTANCLKASGHEGRHHDPASDMEWE